MDLIGGYESSSSSVDSTDPDETPTKKKSSLLPHPTQQLPYVVQPQPESSRTDDPSRLAPTSISKTTQQQKQQQYVGKKILSLASVLPPHILEALTRDDDDDDDDSDNDDGTSRSMTTDAISTKPQIEFNKKVSSHPNTRMPATTNESTVSHSVTTNDNGNSEFSSFLRDLHRVQPSHSSNSNVNDNTIATKDLRPTPQSLSVPSQNSIPSSIGPSAVRMGEAFLQSTTVSLKSTPGMVRDVHATENDMHEDAKRDHASRTSSSSLDRMESKTTANVSNLNRSNSARSRITICAAPTVAQPFTHTDVTASSNVSSLHSISHMNNDMNHNNEIASIEEQRQQPKRSRKEMERALRQGQIQSVLDDQGLTSMEGADPNAYVPEPAFHNSVEPAVPTLRNVTTDLYDPSAGTTVPTAAGGDGVILPKGHRGSGKNQINHLLAQAAHLQRERAQQPTSATQIAKMQRANAKRKYGW